MLSRSERLSRPSASGAQRPALHGDRPDSADAAWRRSSGHHVEDLVTPRVGRKTANIVLNKMFGMVDGIAGGHACARIQSACAHACRWLPRSDLLALLPHELWKDVNEEDSRRETPAPPATPRVGCPMSGIRPSRAAQPVQACRWRVNARVGGCGVARRPSNGVFGGHVGLKQSCWYMTCHIFACISI